MSLSLCCLSKPTWGPWGGVPAASIEAHVSQPKWTPGGIDWGVWAEWTADPCGQRLHGAMLEKHDIR
jgi:hypothetical protein